MFPLLNDKHTNRQSCIAKGVVGSLNSRYSFDFWLWLSRAMSVGESNKFLSLWFLNYKWEQNWLFSLLKPWCSSEMGYMKMFHTPSTNNINSKVFINVVKRLIIMNISVFCYVLRKHDTMLYLVVSFIMSWFLTFHRKTHTYYAEDKRDLSARNLIFNPSSLQASFPKSPYSWKKHCFGGAVFYL